MGREMGRVGSVHMAEFSRDSGGLPYRPEVQAELRLRGRRNADEPGPATGAPALAIIYAIPLSIGADNRETVRKVLLEELPMVFGASARRTFRMADMDPQSQSHSP